MKFVQITKGWDESKMPFDVVLPELVQAALWGKKTHSSVTESVYEEMRKHAIATLIGGSISDLKVSPEIIKKWKISVFQELTFNANYQHVQANLPLTVPYIVLKGTSAAQYYPYPEYRTMGDIDIMTYREDYDLAYQQLKEHGYFLLEEIYKERVMVKDNIVVELHRQFASFNDTGRAKIVDDLILNNINPTHVLPDMINGLVLLGHINQHMEGGLGLRQIIDWMMFVDKCLPDEKWPEFSELVTSVGLDILAITTTRMCELYLGLPSRKWSAEANEMLCTQLMEYVMSCGNFGNKKVTDEEISVNAFTYASNMRTLFRLLQKQGLANWKAAQKHSFLKPFAWVYQANRYLSKGLRRKKAVSKLKTEYENAKKRNMMFDLLGVKTAAKGIAVYKDGKYIKE